MYLSITVLILWETQKVFSHLGTQKLRVISIGPGISYIHAKGPRERCFMFYGSGTIFLTILVSLVLILGQCNLHLVSITKTVVAAITGSSAVRVLHCDTQGYTPLET